MSAPERCPKCGSETPIGHACIVDDLDAIRRDVGAMPDDHPFLRAARGEATSLPASPVASTYTDLIEAGWCPGGDAHTALIAVAEQRGREAVWDLAAEIVNSERDLQDRCEHAADDEDEAAIYEQGASVADRILYQFANERADREQP